MSTAAASMDSTAELAAVSPVEPEPVAGSARLGGPKVYSSPKDIFNEIRPNSSFTLGINYNDHRFFVTCKIRDDRFIAPYNKQSFSRVFHVEQTGSWESALEDVHSYTWRKFELIKETHPADKDHQVPGRIPESVKVALKKEFEKMPERKKY